MRLTLICLIPALLAGCASDRYTQCSKLAGPGWSPMSRPPPNAAQLLELENLPADRDLVWLSKGDDDVMMCDFARGITSPGCGGSSGFEFKRKGDRWVSKGQINDFCDTGPS